VVRVIKPKREECQFLHCFINCCCMPKTNKRDQFAPEERQIADLAKALAHPARIVILKELAKRQSCICGEIVEVLPLSQSTVSQHLRELLQAGLIKGTIDGVRSCYCINAEAFKHFEQLMAVFFDSTQSSYSCC
jgi:ArsR family transcriptional regulator